MLKHKDRRAMNLNDFVVLPNSAAKSVKLNARNLQELKLETGSLAQESEEMEEKLKQLRERMGQEKEERVHSGSFRWKSGQYGPLNSTTTLINTKRNKDSRLQKLSAGKVKIRLLKDEPLTAQPQPPSPSPVGPRTIRTNKLKGTTCGQCEVRTAGVKCAECSEDYCIGCFSKFHQKGALKFHSIIPIQTELKTHVCTQDVVSCFQTQANPSCYPATFSSPNPRPNSGHNHGALSNEFGDQRPENAVIAEHMQIQNHSSQILVAHYKESNNSESPEKEPCLLKGTYDEEESTRSFQEALRQWREAGETTTQKAMWTPPRPATVADVPTQADLFPGGGGAERRVPVRVEFSEHGLTLLDRLLLKKHRRTPIELPPPLLVTHVNSLPESPQKEPEPSLSAEDEECHNYLSSLFAVPTNIQKYGLYNSTPEACLTIEVLDEEDQAVNAEKKSIVNRIVPSHQHTSSKQTAGVSTSNLQTIPSPMQQSKLSRATEETKTALAVCSALSAKPEPCSHPSTATLENNSTSIKTATSKSKKPTRSQTGHKAKAGSGSPQSPLLSSSAPLYRTQTPKSTFSPHSFSPNDSPSTSGSLTSEERDSYPNISPALRSTFTLTPSSSVDSALLPKISHSLKQSPGSSVNSPKQFHHSLLDQDAVQSENQVQFPVSHISPSLSTMSSSSSERNSPLLRTIKSARKSLSLSMSGSTQDVFPRSRLSHNDTHGDTAVCLTSKHVTTSHESMSEQHEQQCLSDPSPDDDRSLVLIGKNEAMSTGYAKESTFTLIQEYHNALKSIQDSEDEMSNDSLNLALCEEESSDEDAEVHSRLESGRHRDDRGNAASTHLGDPFVPADEEGERDLRTDEAEQLSEPSLVMHSQRSRSDLDDLSDDDDESPHSGINPILNRKNFDAVHQSRSSQDLSTPTESAPPLRPLSRVAQEILEICDVDQSGCEDPDMEADTTAHTLSRLERELRLLANETGPEIFTVATGNSRTENPQRNRLYTRSRMSKEELDEEEAAQNDRQCVLLLP